MVLQFKKAGLKLRCAVYDLIWLCWPCWVERVGGFRAWSWNFRSCRSPRHLL